MGTSDRFSKPQQPAASDGSSRRTSWIPQWLIDLLPTAKPVPDHVVELYERLLAGRIVVIGAEIDDRMAEATIAQLQFLEALEPDKELNLYLNSPGGSVTASFAICEAIERLQPALSTVCIGQACGTALLLLTSGTPKKRFALPDARLQFVPTEGGRLSVFSDASAGREADGSLAELRATLFRSFARHSKLSAARVESLCAYRERLSPQVAIEYGLIDGVFQRPRR